ncbi:hypothetical protein DSAG12_03715 [Promethearchaeum syntrophicum]|uniref:Uncharacterized protein n=1 Tax=Promethearchaeum syntrophicum TaxID=2594042 RepID=A0A5B9DGU1_9ARCH|nr:hypothetical protein [Candidatus Prometheoarchaeum syntrophicum]QEE17877.1 hypothetical protein DSAG12_03715 [Candidatus Prometheoarchaeum syntrophicum]
MGKVRILGIIGGFFAIVGIVASLFVELLGWYNAGPGAYVNAIGGGTAGIIASPIVILEFLPGIIAVLGAILCFVPKKITCLIGGLLVIIGAGLFLFGATANFSNFGAFWVSSTVHIGYGWMICVFGGLLGFIGTFVGEE